MPRPYPLPLFSQRGALFGLDARIALAVFAVITLIVGATLVINLNQIRAKSLATELTETGRAIEALTGDIGADIFPSLEQPSEKNAFMALFDNSVLTEADQRRGKWLGPYIRFTSTMHPRHGAMLIQMRGKDHTQACMPESECYNWLVYSNMKRDITLELNAILDDAAEPNPATSGRLQWTADQSADILFYRAGKTLTYRGDW